MQIYQVGGVVRDALLGLPSHDADWVVVGATPEQMMALGYQPVGKDFPVFLHPESHEEYALARTERKTGPGYKGFAVHFSPDVTLEEDLLRRDLTINAMARAHDGSLIDPHNGQRDLQARCFRHVSDAFAEDPVRILRLARFAARFKDFTVAPETQQLMQQMSAAGEVDALVPERVWQELARGLMEAAPARMLEVLSDAGALSRLIPGLTRLDELKRALGRACDVALPLAGRFGLLALACKAMESPAPDQALAADSSDNSQKRGKRKQAANSGEQLAAALRAPNDCRDIARLLISTAPALFDPKRTAHASPAALLEWIQRYDGLRKPERIGLIMASANAWQADSAATLAEQLKTSLAALQKIDVGAIAKPLAKQGPQAIAEALHAARLSTLESLADNG